MRQLTAKAKKSVPQVKLLDLIRQIKLLQAVLMPILDQLPRNNSRA
jgi:hypothetical protein